MKNFKLELAKWIQKYSIVRKANSEAELRSILHKEWFSILSIEAMENIEIQGNKFYFEIFKDGKIQKWTIASDDVFKAYLKIKIELGYDLKFIYDKEDATLEEKQKIMYNLWEQYRIYLEVNKKKLQEKTQKEETIKRVVVEEKIDSFEMKKEVEQVQKVIERVIVKLKQFINMPTNEYLSFEKKDTLKKVHEQLLTLRVSTNISKLKQIWELALSKIAQIELDIVNNSKSQEAKELLKETNKLLKQVGSKESFVANEDDLWYILKQNIEELKNIFSFKKNKKKKREIDTTSGTFLKTKLTLEKYQAKLSQLKKEKLKNFQIYIFPTKSWNKLKEDFYLKERVLKQNILILESRITGTTPSYTKIAKWYYSFIEKLMYSVDFFQSPLLILVCIYSFLFLFLNILNQVGIYDLKINMIGLFYFLFLNITYILMQMVRWVLTLSFQVAILSFLFIFGMINF